MSILSKLIGKIPVVGHGINQIGKVLPSGGQILGGVLGPVGTVVGGAIDGNTTPLQKTIGNTIAGTAGAIGLGGAAGLGGIAKGAASALPFLKDHAGDTLGFLKDHGGQALDLGLGTAGMINAANLGAKSDKYATNAFDLANKNWQSREPLRLAGVSGMLNPTPGTDVNTIGTRARATNPFASKALPLPVKPNG